MVFQREYINTRKPAVRRKVARTKRYKTEYICRKCGAIIGITPLGTSWCDGCGTRKSRAQMSFSSGWVETHAGTS